MKAALFVLDVDDFRPLAEVAAALDHVDVVKRGPYFEVSSEVAFEIDRNATGCRNAVWFSAVAAVRGGHVSVWDKAVMRIEPGTSRGRQRDVACTEKNLNADLDRDIA